MVYLVVGPIDRSKHTINYSSRNINFLDNAVEAKIKNIVIITFSFYTYMVSGSIDRQILEINLIIFW